MTKSRTWRCPKCKQEINAIAREVAHRCPSNKNLSTQWQEADKKDE